MTDFSDPTTQAVRRQYCRRVGQKLSLKEQANGDCVLLENGTCRVYECRPVQCVTFPFWRYNLMTRQRWEDLAGECPGINRRRLRSFEEIEDALKKDF